MYKPKTYGIVEKAPWSTEMVNKLNKYQQTEPFHPYTCGHDHGKEVKLIATTNGWKCPEANCNYTQDWCFGETLTI